jgi:predicted HTH domain antitoxin
MQITLDLPDELIQHFNPNRLPQEIVEALAVQAYQTEKITHGEVGCILGLSSRWAVDEFLKTHKADLHYDEADLERDRATLHQLRESKGNSAS